MGRLTIVATALIGLAAEASAGTAFQSVFSNDPKDYQMEGVNDQYRSEIAKGLQARAVGDLSGAIKHLSAASTMPIFEYPNYGLWPDLAELYCRTGQMSRGRAFVRDFACAVDVLAARKTCWLDKHGKSTTPNPALSSLCYQTVCSEMYVAYFGQEPGAGAQDKNDKAKISKLRNICN